MAKSAEDTIAASRWFARSASRCSPMSRKTRTTPATAPLRVVDRRAAVGDRDLPSVAGRAAACGWRGPTTRPSRSPAARGSRPAARLVSLTMRNTSSTGRPTASAAGQPVRLLGDGIQERDAGPGGRSARTASPMLRSVVLSCSWISRAAASARSRPSRSRRATPKSPAEEHEERGAADRARPRSAGGRPPGAERPLGEQPAFFGAHARRRLPDALHGLVAEPRFDRAHAPRPCRRRRGAGSSTAISSSFARARSSISRRRVCWRRVVGRQLPQPREVRRGTAPTAAW